MPGPEKLGINFFLKFVRRMEITNTRMKLGLTQWFKNIYSLAFFRQTQMQTSPLEQCLSEEVLIWLRFNLLKTTAKDVEAAWWQSIFSGCLILSSCLEKCVHFGNRRLTFLLLTWLRWLNTTFGVWFAAHICSLVPRDGRLLSLGWGSDSIPNEGVEVFSGVIGRWIMMLSCGLEQL